MSELRNRGYEAATQDGLNVTPDYEDESVVELRQIGVQAIAMLRLVREKMTALYELERDGLVGDACHASHAKGMRAVRALQAALCEYEKAYLTAVYLKMDDLKHVMEHVSMCAGDAMAAAAQAVAETYQDAGQPTGPWIQDSDSPAERERNRRLVQPQPPECELDIILSPIVFAAVDRVCDANLYGANELGKVAIVTGRLECLAYCAGHGPLSAKPIDYAVKLVVLGGDCWLVDQRFETVYGLLEEFGNFVAALPPDHEHFCKTFKSAMDRIVSELDANAEATEANTVVKARPVLRTSVFETHAHLILFNIVVLVLCFVIHLWGVILLTFG